jgi:hypothetical protein
MRAGTPTPIRPQEEATLERVQREVLLRPRFEPDDFERAFESFVSAYNVSPSTGRCSPEVLDRYCRLYERGDEAARHRYVRFRGVPLFAAVLPAGTIVFEGEVDEDRMGDW